MPRPLPSRRRRRSLGSGLVRLLASLAAVSLVACGDGAGSRHRLDESLRLDQIQALGTHNSYHVQPREPLFSALVGIVPPVARAWEYTHRPLPDQLGSLGVRQIELDVWADPDGGLFAHRPVLAFLGLDPDAGVPSLERPGFKVLHVADLDFESTCWTFVECLAEVHDWSRAHPGHAPILILVELKDEATPDPFDLGFLDPVPIGSAELDALDAEIRSVFAPDEMLSPDDVRGDAATLLEAIEARGWPTLAQARGRVLFALDNGGEKKRAYLDGHPSLRGRVLFTSSEPPEPAAAFVKLNDPIADGERIRDLVARGFLIRTRADADTEQARSGDVSRRDAALASGAQYVSTDYPEPDPSFGTGYQVRIPGGRPARCNPVSAPSGCTALDVEDPSLLGAR